MAAPVAFEQRMSEQEALMWALELDPVLRSSFANVSFLDRPVDPVTFGERMRRVVDLVPRLRQRVGSTGPGLATPAWLDDPLFDLEFHVRSVAVPAPGDDRAVLDLAAVLASDPFDRARPLWQFVLVEGLAGGRGAMIQKLHHSITDGEGGIRLSAAFVDVERDAVDPLVSGADPPSATTTRSPTASVLDSVAAGVRLPLGLARSTVAGAVEAFVNPAGAPARAGDAVETARSIVRQLAVTEPARSPLWTGRSLRRRLEVLSIPLAEAKQVAGRLGGTVNDWFVTGATGAAGAYHRRSGAPVDELRMAMPISTRDDSAEAKASGTNSFAPTRVLVPTGIDDPVERFRAVRARLGANKVERAVGNVGRLAGLLSVLPGPLLARVARQQVGTVDFTTSNVRGAPFPLYIGGALVLSNHPVGPLAGTAFNLTTMSYDGTLDMGCIVDTGAIADADLLRSCLVDAYEELRTATA